MRRVLRDLAGILVIYALYGAVTVLLYDPETFKGDNPPMWPVWMWIGSLVGILMWYLLGEWVIRPNASSTTWYVTWFGLLILVLIWACCVTFLEMADTTQKSDSYPILHFMGGIGAYYLASVLFSPLFGAYKIWPAKLVRKW